MSNLVRKILLIVLFLALLGVLAYLILQLTGSNSSPTAKSGSKPAAPQTSQSRPSNTPSNSGATARSTSGQSPSSAGQPQPPTPSSNLANTGPGDVAALFVLAVFAGSLAANRFLARRA